MFVILFPEQFSKEKQMTDNLGYKKGMAFLQASEHIHGEKTVYSSRSCMLVLD